MNSADLITSFFNNELSPDQERQFLLSVASSDSMRLGLKSHVMLDRILQEENQEAGIEPNTRRKILREAAAVAALAAGGSQQAAAAEASAPSAPAASAGGFSTWGASLLSLLVAAGSFFAGFYIGDSSGVEVLAGQDSALPSVETTANMPHFADLDEIVALPVRRVADELTPVLTADVDPEPTSVAGVEPTVSSPARASSSNVGSSQGSSTVAVSDTTEGADQGSGIGSPNPIDAGPTSVKKPNR